MIYLGKNIPGICDRCGRKVKHETLESEVVRGKDVGNMVCDECWDEDHPQLWVGSVPVSDKQSVRDAQPEPNKLTDNSLWGFNPVGAPGNFLILRTGKVSIEIS